MSNSISMQFADKKYHRMSAILSNHWDGKTILNIALDFINKLKHTHEYNVGGTPISRMEPDAVMCNFVAFLIRNSFTNEHDPYTCEHSLRLIDELSESDNDDNGHFIVWCDTEEIQEIR